MNKLFTLVLFLPFLMFQGCHQAPATHKKMNQQQVKNQQLFSPWTHKSNIYEVNIRQYTPEGTFAAFMPHIRRLHRMGVDILWLMPINPIGEKNRKGTLGSYYSISNYTAVNPEFGTLDDFKVLVDEAHKLGMHVIIDWVANHTAWDHPWVKQHPEWYKHNDKGEMESPFDWTDVLALNYDNYELWKAMTAEMKYWLRETDIDGFRCDVAMLVPTAFWDSARSELQKVKPLFMLAEAEKPDLHLQAFDACYSWEMFHLWQEIAKGNKGADDIWQQLRKEDSLFPQGTYHMLFTSNHDENSWNGTDHEMFGDATRTFGVLSWMLRGIPLIYSGQEAGLDRRLRFFDKDTISWQHLYAEKFYTTLATIKSENEALYNGNYGGAMQQLSNKHPKALLTFARTKNDNRVLVLINLSKNSLEAQIDLRGMQGSYTNAFTGEPLTVAETLTLHFDPWQYYVFVKK